jgi:diguanylate cyclase (GGDEF)-like protein
MSSILRACLSVFAALVGIVGAVFVVSESQRSAADRGYDSAVAASAVRSAQLELNAALHGFLDSGEANALAGYHEAEANFNRQMLAAQQAAGDAPAEQASLERQELLSERWQALAARQILARRGKLDTAPDGGQNEARLAGFLGENDDLKALLADQRSADLAGAQRISIGVIIVIAVAFTALSYLLVVRRVRDRGRRSSFIREDRRAQDEFTATLQVMRDEREAQQLVRRHLERSIEDSTVVMMNHHSSANRLEAATGVDDDGPLAQRLLDANPEACLAARLAHEHQEDGTLHSLISCELCGGLGNSTCIPSLVGGEVIGSVLVRAGKPLLDHDRERVRLTVNLAAPVLANLRSLAIAESEAATDELTGLPNKRASNDTLRRMIAHATRTMTPLSAVIFDLDHFKEINDRFGHGAGDDALAAIGALLAERVRASDFAGRFGGEEFLLLLPETGAADAKRLAETLRNAIAAINPPNIDLQLTASFGIAVHPDHALEAEHLLRLADRALYAAKSSGRNAVRVAKPSGEERPTELASPSENGAGTADDPGQRVQ